MKISELQEFTKDPFEGISGLVPTMGNLHEGHLSLIRQAKEECDRVILTIYVNPKQFAPQEDLENYPRTLEKDFDLAEKAGADIVLTPTDEEMYPSGFSTLVRETSLSSPFCGRSRPSHFEGVTTIVLKLFNLTRPQNAYFGLKDYQQVAVIRKMTEDLNLPIQIRACPIVREKDGLAMSSRNQALTPNEREKATALVKSLRQAEELYRLGCRDPLEIEKVTTETLFQDLEGLQAVVDYVECLDAKTLAPPHLDGKSPWVLGIAVKFPMCRLIDNTVLGTSF